MTIKLVFRFFSLIGLLIITISCSSKNVEINSEDEFKNTINELEILEIPLDGVISKRTSEISGLCWYKDKLLLLPQYPKLFNEGKIFYIEKSRLDDYLSDINKSPIKPGLLSINLEDINDLFHIGSGFESITIINNTAFFTIESLNKGKTQTFLIKGEINFDDKSIKLDKNSLVKLEIENPIHNISHESILQYNNRVIPIYEANGLNIKTSPEIPVYDNKLNFLNNIDFPNIEYRITDVTSIDKNNRFWAINYLYPGEIDKLKVTKDRLSLKYGIGKSHVNSEIVERLVEFEISDRKIKLVNKAPKYLKLHSKTGRNWEGIARYGDNGFFLVTDTFPRTIFGYIKTK